MTKKQLVTYYEHVLIGADKIQESLTHLCRHRTQVILRLKSEIAELKSKLGIT